MPEESGLSGLPPDEPSGLTVGDVEELCREAAQNAVNEVLGRLEHVGWIDELGQLYGAALRSGDVTTDRRVYALITEGLDG